MFTSSFKKEKFIQILGSQRTNLRKPYDVLTKIRICVVVEQQKVAHLLVLSQTEDKHVLSCIPVGMIRMGLIKSIQSELMVDERRYNAWYGRTWNVLSPPREILVLLCYFEI